MTPAYSAAHLHTSSTPPPPSPAISSVLPNPTIPNSSLRSLICSPVWIQGLEDKRVWGRGRRDPSAVLRGSEDLRGEGIHLLSDSRTRCAARARAIRGTNFVCCSCNTPPPSSLTSCASPSALLVGILVVPGLSRASSHSAHGMPNNDILDDERGNDYRNSDHNSDKNDCNDDDPENHDFTDYNCNNHGCYDSNGDNNDLYDHDRDNHGFNDFDDDDRDFYDSDGDNHGFSD